jgi:hypothetical protein
MLPRPLCRKIEDDFRGALNNHPHTPIQLWILVHNDHEHLPTEAHELIIKLRGEPRSAPIEILGPDLLLTLIMGLPREKLTLLFPYGLAADDLRKIHYHDIDQLIRTIGELTLDSPYSDVDAPSSRKISHNGFSEAVIGVLKGGFLVQHRFANYFADTSRAVVGNLLAEKFKKLYREKKAGGIDADQIFWGLIDAVGGLACEVSRRAAIIGLVNYMFHSCEIFEDAPAAASA